MASYAADIETSGLLEQMKLQLLPVLHNMGFKDMNTGEEILFSNRYFDLDLIDNVQYKNISVRPLDKLQSFLSSGHKLYMHNGKLFDNEALIFLKVDEIEQCHIEDTLYMSWYLDPKRMRHGLGEYGEDYGIPKPVVEDWENQTQDEYNHRVMQDVRIQYRLVKEQTAQLKKMYPQGFGHVLEYINLKANHMQTQQRNKWKLDEENCAKLQVVLEDKLEIQVVELQKVMPKVEKFGIKEPPAKPYKANGELSAHGLKWFTLLLQNHLPKDTRFVKVVLKIEEPNPNSPSQVKDWLDSYGWVPETFKFTRDKETGEEKKTPQVNVPNSGGKVDPGIIALIKKHPNAGFENIKGLGILKHRLGMVKGFLSNAVDGYLTARAQGFTNTLRLKHKELVNLPSGRVPYGEDIRALLVAELDYTLLGSDLSSLEDKCKHHYQWPLDPEYVKLQQQPGFDPHLMICGMAEILSEAEIAFYKEHKHDKDPSDEMKAKLAYLDLKRYGGKGTNYACQYGAGAKTVARTAGVSQAIGDKLWQAYQDLNWSIKAIAESTTVMKSCGYSWQLNPVNKIWYWLKSEKDRFSTLCQGTGSYICDIWIEAIHSICRERYGSNAFVLGEFHDEVILKLKDKPKAKEIMEGIVQEAIGRVNAMLKLNTTLACDVSFGNNYSLIH
ncbi:hypothetical protein [Pseudomonas laurylsulfatiphila]|uniref:hypothetical protein n=1 Tax=Pseudomonas laurylsulfatiphila TaxID=2011015 RepID=UPI003D225A75